MRIYATMMAYAQGWQPSPAERALLVARADEVRRLLGEAGPQVVVVPVHDSYDPERCIGSLRFRL